MSVIKGTDTIVAGFGGTKRSIGEVYFSQSSLATDNSGALPLFTGETIASANTIYPDFYKWVLAHTELQCTSAEYESALSTYGECPKYVIGGGSLRLPKLSNYIKVANTAEGITQKEAGLPNITGDVLPNEESGNTWTLKTGGYSGAFSAVAISNAAVVANIEQNKSVGIHFDASKSNPIYGKSDTVTPAHTTLYPWVVAYTAAIPASEVQVAEFQQGLSGKVSKSGDTMTGNLNLNAGLLFGNYRDTAARIQLPGVVEGKYYQIVNNASESEAFLQFYDDQTKGVVLIKSQGSQPYYFDGTNPYRLLTTADLPGNAGSVGFPNYGAATSFPTNTNFTAPSDGVIHWWARTGQGPLFAKINDIQVGAVSALGGSDSVEYTGTFIVKKGDIFYGPSETPTNTFYPFR